MPSFLEVLSLLIVIYPTNGQIVDCEGNCACPTTVSDTTCTLNCDGKDRCKDAKLKCRTGDPCEIRCNGESSCEGNSVIDASGATDVTVSCIGTNACKGNTKINCGTASCSLSCDDSTSCEGSNINTGAATRFSCTGLCSSAPDPFVLTTDAPTHTTSNPTAPPSLTPTKTPTMTPTKTPTMTPTKTPTMTPTKTPTIIPTFSPTKTPTMTPTLSPITTSTAVETTTSTTEQIRTINATDMTSTQASTVITTTSAFYTTTIEPTSIVTSTTTDNTMSTDPMYTTHYEPTADETRTSRLVATETVFETSKQRSLEQHTKQKSFLSTNPIWYLLIASAGLIVLGSIMCFCAIHFYYKRLKIIDELPQDNAMKQEPKDDEEDGANQGSNTTVDGDKEITDPGAVALPESVSKAEQHTPSGDSTQTSAITVVVVAETNGAINLSESDDTHDTHTGSSDSSSSSSSSDSNCDSDTDSGSAQLYSDYTQAAPASSNASSDGSIPIPVCLPHGAYTMVHQIPPQVSPQISPQMRYQVPYQMPPPMARPMSRLFVPHPLAMSSYLPPPPPPPQNAVPPPLVVSSSVPQSSQSLPVKF
eukprot:136306_1